MSLNKIAPLSQLCLQLFQKGILLLVSVYWWLIVFHSSSLLPLQHNTLAKVVLQSFQLIKGFGALVSQFDDWSFISILVIVYVFRYHIHEETVVI